MKGVILGLNLEKAAILILGPDDKRYRLLKSEWKSSGDPSVGMNVDFINAGDDLAKAVYFIPEPTDRAQHKFAPSSILGVLKLWIESRRVGFINLLPATCRSGRALLLLAALISIMATIAISFIADVAKKARREREAPMRAAAQWQSDLVYVNRCGNNTGVMLGKAGLATGFWRARTEAEARLLAFDVWTQWNDPNLKSICGGSIRPVGGNYESPEAQEAFVDGFVEGYLKEITDFKRRNRSLY